MMTLRTTPPPSRKRFNSGRQHPEKFPVAGPEQRRDPQHDAGELHERNNEKA